MQAPTQSYEPPLAAATGSHGGFLVDLTCNLALASEVMDNALELPSAANAPPTTPPVAWTSARGRPTATWRGTPDRARACALALVALCLAGCAREAQCSGPPPTGPTSLKECYLQVAMEKSTADTAYVAKTLCDEIFGRWPLSVFVLAPNDPKCMAWTFDDLGHYESAELYCAIEPAGEARWTFSCESKNPKLVRFGLVEVKETDAGYERVGDAIGHDPGRIFKTLAACLKAKAER